MTWAELDHTGREVLIELYAAEPRTVDDLPYTIEFERMREAFNRRTGMDLSAHDFWRALSSARKTGTLRRKER